MARHRLPRGRGRCPGGHGPGRILGNHVVIQHGDGGYAMLAHLQRGSATVARGDQVRAGEAVAQCGNSGGSSEPHLHFQLMDVANPILADGIPFRFAEGTVEGTLGHGVPGKKETFDANPTIIEDRA